MSQQKSIALFYQEGASDKVYNVSLQEDKGGWVVNFSYGRRGNALQNGTKTPTPLEYEKAVKVYDKLVAEKTGKGYEKVGGEDEEELTGEKEGERKAGMDTIDTVSEKRDSKLRPQLLNEIDGDEVEKFINNPEYCMQEKHDGKRRGLIKNNREILGTNKKGIVVIPSKSIMNLLGDLINDVELDGEDMGDYMMVFDITFLNRDIKSLNYISRYAHLQALLEKKGALRVVETAWTTAEKEAMFKRLKKENAEGVVFKRIDAPYKAGRPNSGGDQLKFKFRATASCIVKEVNKTKRSVSLQVREGKKLIDVGNVTVYPNQEIPKPGQVVEVKYLYYFKDGSLFQPVLLGERDDVDSDECVIGQLKYKKEEQE